MSNNALIFLVANSFYFWLVSLGDAPNQRYNRFSFVRDSFLALAMDQRGKIKWDRDYSGLLLQPLGKCGNNVALFLICQNRLSLPYVVVARDKDRITKLLGCFFFVINLIPEGALKR